MISLSSSQFERTLKKSFQIEFKFLKIIINYSKGILNPKTMKNIETPLKRSKQILNEEKITQCPFISLRNPLRALSFENTQKPFFVSYEKKKKWTKKQEQKLLLLLLKRVVDQPYLSFSWEFYEQEKNLKRISEGIIKSLFSCSQKMNELKSVHKEKHQDLGFIQFLMTYWSEQKFTSKIGKEYVESIKILQKSKSQHMIMCDKMMQSLKKREQSFMNLYDLIMKS